MRPTTPRYEISQNVDPSPPDTPSSSTFTFQNIRQATNFSRPIPKPIGITPNGTGPHFSYNRPEEISPRSTSPTSESSGSASPPRSLSSEPLESPLSSPRDQPRIFKEGNFTLEEVTESDLERYDTDDEDLIIRPHQYEEAESEQGNSVEPVQEELDPNFLRNLEDLDCKDGPSYVDELLEEHEAWVQRERAERRRRRRSSATVAKRKHAQSLGSDTDEEDLQPVQISAHEAGSSARRLRRKVGDRTSLIFDDPPPKIPELDEPAESCEEVLLSTGEETGIEDLRELPYYVLQEDNMDLDESTDGGML